MTAIRSFTNPNSYDINDRSNYCQDNAKSLESVECKIQEDPYLDEFISNSETTIQPMTFAEGTNQKVKSALQSYDANSSFISERLNQPQPPVIVVTKRFMPDGSVEITTKKDGQVVDRTKKKPHMTSVKDPLTGKTKLEPFISVFDPDFM